MAENSHIRNQHLRTTKLRVWSFTEFEKVILMDSDMVVLKNIDHLFAKPDGSAGKLLQYFVCNGYLVLQYQC